MEANKKCIAEIFNGSNIFEVPFFQREYVWSKDNWARFYKDMSDTFKSKKDYFLGSLILKEKVTNDDDHHFNIIDGQQRLTTIFLYFKAFSDSLKNKKMGGGERERKR